MTITFLRVKEEAWALNCGAGESEDSFCLGNLERLGQSGDIAKGRYSQAETVA